MHVHSLLFPKFTTRCLRELKQSGTPKSRVLQYVVIIKSQVFHLSSMNSVHWTVFQHTHFHVCLITFVITFSAPTVRSLYMKMSETFNTWCSFTRRRYKTFLDFFLSNQIKFSFAWHCLKFANTCRKANNSLAELVAATKNNLTGMMSWEWQTRLFKLIEMTTY